MNEYPMVAVRLYLLDRQVNLIDEGIDVALRIAHLADSNFVAIRLGEVRRVIAASPRYLAQHPSINEPADLAKHRIIAMTHFGLDSWSFPPLEGLVRSASRPVHAAAGRQHGARGGRLGRRKDTASRGCSPITSPTRSATDGCRSCSARTNIRRCRCICSPRKGVCRCPRCAPSSTSPPPASSGISRGCRPRPTRTPAAIRSLRGRVPAE